MKNPHIDNYEFKNGHLEIFYYFDGQEESTFFKIDDVEFFTWLEEHKHEAYLEGIIEQRSMFTGTFEEFDVDGFKDYVMNDEIAGEFMGYILSQILNKQKNG